MVIFQDLASPKFAIESYGFFIVGLKIHGFTSAASRYALHPTIFKLPPLIVMASAALHLDHGSTWKRSL